MGNHEKTDFFLNQCALLKFIMSGQKEDNILQIVPSALILLLRNQLVLSITNSFYFQIIHLILKPRKALLIFCILKVFKKASFLKYISNDDSVMQVGKRKITRQSWKSQHEKRYKTLRTLQVTLKRINPRMMRKPAKLRSRNLFNLIFQTTFLSRL